jgi:tRNA pseudouridine38-40 synthase
MQNLTPHFHGRYAFSAFCANRGDGSTPNPFQTMGEMKCEKFNRSIVFTLVADGFLYKMVQMLMGSFVMLGLRKISGNVVLDMLLSGKRITNVDVAPSNGLCLHAVEY